MPQLLSIDPGQYTGVAMWGMKKWKELVPPLATWLLHGRKEEWGARCDELASQLDRILDDHNVVRIFCEIPALFQSSRSFATAASGDLIKLAYLVGKFSEVARQQGVTFETVPVIRWKGQLKKPVVIKRITKKIGKGNYHRDEWDAVGIGLWAKGFF